MKNDTINVLHILSSLGLGGTERLIYYLAKYWNNPDIKIHICTLFSKDDQQDEPLLGEIEKLGYKVFRVSLKSWRDFDTYNKLKNYINQNNIDIVHSHSGACEFWGPLFAKISGVKYNIITKHHTSHPKKFIERITRTIILQLFIDKVISVSETVKNFVIDKYYVKSNKIVRIYNPVDLNHFHQNINVRNEIRTELKISDQDFVIGNTSRFDPMKGHNFFIKSAKIISKKIKNSKFIIIVDAMNKNKIESQLANSNLKNNFIILSPNNRIHKIIQSFDLFLFTSIFGEGFGIVLIEAIAAGIPIVASNIGPTKEIIKHGFNGLLPTPQKWKFNTNYLDAKLLADATIKIYKNEELKIRLLSNGYKSLEPFSIDNYLNKLESLYLSL